jgi:protein-tyrosine phosphatase
MTRRQRSHRIDTATLSLLLALGLNPLGVGGAQTAVSSVQSSSRSGERHIALDGAPNFRDLGGYATADGRHVRWNRIYRSGELSRLTDADYERLAQLRIAVVCDFRRDSERNAAPTTWRGATPPTILNLPGAQTERTGNPGAGRADAGTTQSGLSPLLMESYPTYPRTLGASFRTVLQQIMTQQGAVLYHCTAGKDRTGTFSALLLTMLGVARDVVMADYLLTNEFVAISADRIDAIVARGGSRESAIATLGVDRAYLDLMFQTIDTEFGSFDAYRRTVLGVSDDDLVALKATLLE